MSGIIEGKAIDEKGLPLLLTLLSELKAQHIKAKGRAVKFDAASPDAKRQRKK